jgi:hypothetical protein
MPYASAVVERTMKVQALLMRAGRPDVRAGGAEPPAPAAPGYFFCQ